MEIRTIAVIGAGTMGRAIARATLAAGYRTILEDVLPERLAAAEAEIQRWLDDVAAQSGGAKAKEQAVARLSTAPSVAAACREADLVLETLPEEMEIKIDVFCILEKFARPGAILATNAASLSISEIAAVTTRAEQCVALHFCEGASASGLLEVVRGRETSEGTVEACRAMGRRLGKEVVVVREPQAESYEGTERELG